MNQSERSKFKYGTARPSSSPTKHSDMKDSVKAYWKYLQGRNLDVSPVRNYIQHHSTSAEPSDSCYSANAYKPHKHHSYQNALHSKYLSGENSEPTRRCKQPPSRFNPNNIAIVRKTHYKDELDDEETLKYTGEESGNFTEENVDEDAADEADEDQEETAESADKDYEEQDTDEEIDEESDMCPEIRQIQRRMKEACIKPRSPIEQSPDDIRKLQYEQYLRLQKAYRMQQPKARYYRHASHEMGEALSEENISPPIARSSSRKSPINVREYGTSNSLDKYHGTMPPIHATRRSRLRQEVEPAIDQEIDTVRKCTCCGSSSTKKSSSAKKNSCRFQDQLNFPVKGPTGDEIEINGKPYCGQCNMKPEMEDIPGICDKSRFHSLQPRRTKIPRSLVYEGIEDRRVVNDVSNDYVKNRHPKDTLHERTKHSVQTVHDQARIPSRYND